MLVSRQIFLRMRIFQAKRVQKIKARILFSISFSKNRTLYEIMCKKYGKARQATDDNITRCMCFACWITKATDIHTQNIVYSTYFFVIATMVTRTHPTITLYVRGPSCWFNDLSGFRDRYIWFFHVIINSSTAQTISRILWHAIATVISRHSWENYLFSRGAHCRMRTAICNEFWVPNNVNIWKQAYLTNSKGRY
jgi:hypothetical protein